MAIPPTLDPVFVSGHGSGAGQDGQQLSQAGGAGETGERGGEDEGEGN